MSVLKSILLLTIILAMAACGLPDQYYIQAPTAGITPAGTGSQFSFSNPDHTKDLNINFKGYEIYYQLYAHNSDDQHQSVRPEQFFGRLQSAHGCRVQADDI